MTERIKTTILATTLLLWGASALPLQAQTGSDAHQHSDMAQGSEVDIGKQLSSIQLKLGEIEAALKMDHMGESMGGGSMDMMDMKDMPMKGMMDSGMMKSGKMKGMLGMSMGDSTDASMNMDADTDTMSMGGMGKKKMGMSMGMDKKKMSMDSMGDGMSMGMMGSMGKMGKMKGMGDSMAMDSALPGFPGISHIYHIGATGFFLDHKDHLKLTSEQLLQLGKLKQSTELKQATADREIEQAEQELWELTAADAPDLTKIKTKVESIADARSKKRLDFIRSVGEAAQVLTDAQRQLLSGESPAMAPEVDHSAH